MKSVLGVLTVALILAGCAGAGPGAGRGSRGRRVHG